MNLSKPIILTSQLLLLTSISGLVMAEQSVNETRDMGATASVSVELVSGELNVEAWNRNSFALTGKLGNDKDKLSIDRNGDGWSIEIKPKGGWGWKGSSGNTKLNLMVPHAAELEIESVSADLDITGLDGEEVMLETVSGDIRIAVQSDAINISTISGDVDLTAEGSNLDYESVSGDLDATGIEGELDVETVSGDFEIVGTKLEDVSASSVSGDIDLELTLDESADVDLESHSGKIVLLLPKGTRFEFDADTFSGDIDNALGSDDDADIQINAETFSGNIVIKNK